MLEPDAHYPGDSLIITVHAIALFAFFPMKLFRDIKSDMS